MQSKSDFEFVLTGSRTSNVSYQIVVDVLQLGRLRTLTFFTTQYNYVKS